MESTFAKLRWWIFVNVLLGATIVGVKLGALQFLIDADRSKISLFTLGLFYLMTGFVGYLTLKQSKFRELTNADKKQIEACWFMGEFLMGMGIVGTVLGIILTFGSDIESFNFEDADAVKKATLSMSRSLTQAFVTTLVGMTTSLLLKLQLVNYDLGKNEKL